MPGLPLILPRKIDRYLVEGVVGEGGMGRVYRAFDPRIGRRVAVKVMLVNGSSDRERAAAAARTTREARAAGAFNHPNVVAIYDVGDFDGSPFIAMELVEGVTLRQAFADPLLLPAQKIAWLVDVARGLGAAHRAGLVHRDVKPENVMITTDGVAKILDFGIARATSEPQAVDPIAPTSGADPLATLTARGLTLGTPQYMPPEQLQSEPLDGRCDQFAWAVMAWELLAGSLPWGDKQGPLLITAVLTAPAPPLKEHARGVDARLSDAIGRALEKNRAQRFATMEDLVTAITGEELPSVPRGSLGRIGGPRTTHDTGPTFTQATRAMPATRARSLAARGAIAVGVAALAAGAVLAGAHRWRESSRAATAAASASASARTTPGEDVAPYFARAEADERDGRHDRACAEYARASEASPSSTPAALAALMCHRNDPRGGRDYFRRAWKGRATLSPRDAALLDAYEPYFQRDPIDLKEEGRRLEAAVARFPDDAELRYFLAGTYRLDSLTLAKAVDTIEDSLRLDPVPHVMAIKAEFLAYDGDFAGSRATIDRCLRLAPDALDCLKEEVWLDSEAGDCASAERGARRRLAIDPAFEEAGAQLANAVYAQGGSLEAARALLRRARSSKGPNPDMRRDEARLAILGGDLAGAERIVRSLADDAKDSVVAAEHGAPLALLADLEEELGRDADAAAVADTYLEGRDAWEPDPEFDDWAMADEPTPRMLAARRRAGRLAPAAYDAEIARTVERWKARVTPAIRSFIWIYAYAYPAETADDATTALAHLGEFQPQPRYKPLSLADEAIGKTYLLAGKTDEAIEALQRATRACFPIDFAMEHTRAHAWLGAAYEAKGDVAKACVAYRVVRDRWGRAPKSVTAAKVAARMAALKCPP